MGGQIGIAVILVLAITAHAKDVFRYVDEESGQSHYMTGEPGKSVEGGWTFTNADGSYELTYRADEAGFQPKAEHIPVPVEDTNEVVEARANFYSLFKEHEAKVKEALEASETEQGEMVLDVKRKRETSEDDEEMEAKTEAKKSEKLVYAHGDLFGQPLKYSFHPFLGFVPNYAEKAEEMSEEAPDMKDMEYKFVPYFGFVPADGKSDDEGSDDDVRYKFDPLYGFVQVKKEGEDEPMEPVEEQEYKYVPYVGFVPLTDEDKESEDLVSYKFNPFYGFVEAKKEDEMESKDEPKYKFVPYYGFVPVNEKEMSEKSEEEEKDENMHLQYVFHPYHGYLPTMVKKPEMKMDEQLYTYNPMHGFVPVPEEEPEVEVEEPKERKKRDAQMFVYPSYPVYPQYVVPNVRYVVANVAKTAAAADETSEEETPQTLPAVVDTQVPLPGLVPVQIIRTPVIQQTQLQPLVVVQNPLPASQYPVIPNEPDSEKPGAFEF